MRGGRRFNHRSPPSVPEGRAPCAPERAVDRLVGVVGGGCEDRPVSDLLPGLDAGVPVVGSADAVLAALDPEQREVALALSGPVVVLAGAGTGKTRAITHRIAYGVLTGRHDPRRTLAVTFTARAAGEMRHRLAAARRRGRPGPHVPLRGAAAAALLLAAGRRRRRAGDPAEQGPRSSAPCCAAAGWNDPTLARDVAAEIEWAKASQVVAADYPAAALRGPARAAGLAEPRRRRHALRGVRRAQDRRRLHRLRGRPAAHGRACSTPASTSPRRCARSTAGSPSTSTRTSTRCSSDCSTSGSATATTCASSATRARRSTPSPERRSSYLLDFRKRFPHATEVRLVRSYRSTPQVVSLANRVLASATGAEARLRLELRATRTDGPEPRITAYDDEPAEAAGLAAAVEEADRCRHAGPRDRGAVPHQRAVRGVRGGARRGRDPLRAARRVGVLRARRGARGADPAAGRGPRRRGLGRPRGRRPLGAVGDELVAGAAQRPGRGPRALGEPPAARDARRRPRRRRPCRHPGRARRRPRPARHRAGRPHRGRRHALHGARGQGPRVGRGLRRGPRAGHVPDPARRHPGARGGGAPPVLRRLHPRPHPSRACPGRAAARAAAAATGLSSSTPCSAPSPRAVAARAASSAAAAPARGRSAPSSPRSAGSAARRSCPGRSRRADAAPPARRRTTRRSSSA